MLEIVNNGSEQEYLFWNAAEVVGRAVVRDNGEEVEIRLINVARHRRGEGIGSYLLDRIIADHGEKDIFTWTFKAREAWYSRRGFKNVEERASLIKMFRKGSVLK